MKEIVHRLQEMGPTITKLLEVSTAAGASIVVLHNGEIIHTANFGYRDISRKIPADENTVYHIASLTKSFTATGLSIAADNGDLSWDQPIIQILPDLSQDDHEVAQKATVLDLLSHRTGLASKNALWLQDGIELLLPKEALLPIVSYLERVHPLRSAWLYNKYGFSLASVILEKVTKNSWADALQDSIFQPLNLTRTFIDPQDNPENEAIGYLAMSDSALKAVDRPAVGDGTIMQGANGVRSSVNDLLLYYKALLQAYKENLNNVDRGCGHEKHAVLGNVQRIFAPNILLDQTSEFGEAYGAGWVLAQLPAPLGRIGTNGMFLSKMPEVGKGGDKRQIWYHNGNLVGFFSSVHILPETDTAIIVLVNSLARNDCADWIGQLVLETFLDNPNKNDYISLARDSAASFDSMWAQIEDNRKKEKVKPPASRERPIEEYTGKYYNRPGNWYITISAAGQEIELKFQGRTTLKHRARRHENDEFSWFLGEKESVTLGRWPDLDPEVYIFQFQENNQGQIHSLRWRHDFDVLEGEVFIREGFDISGDLHDKSE